MEEVCINIKLFIDNPSSGVYWNKCATYKIKESEIMKQKVRISIAAIIEKKLEEWYFNFPDIFELSTEFLNTKNWQPKFFHFENEKYKGEEAIGDIASDLSYNNLIKSQLVKMGIDVVAILYEWQNLKSKLCLWVNCNSCKSWDKVDKKVENLGLNNLFHLVDFLLCHSMSSAEVEAAFSSMKNMTDKRTKLIISYSQCSSELNYVVLT